MGDKITNSLRKPTVAVSVSGLEKCFFYYGHGTQKHWVESNTTFTNYVGSKYGQSMKASITTGELVVTGIDETLSPKFKTAEEKKTHLSSLEYWDQEQYEATKEDSLKLSRIIRKDLSAVCGLLCSLCHVSS